MISHGKEIKVFTGNSNPVLAEEICAHLNKTLGNATVTQFADGECSISVHEPVRGCDVFIVQSTCKSVNDNLMELLVMIDAMRRASAGRITAVIPYFGYARQDRKAKSRDPISAKLVANLITAAGADRVLTMFPPSRPVRTKNHEEVSTYYGEAACACNSLVADGCIIEGTVNNSILFSDVRVAPGAVLDGCIVMRGGVIGENAQLKNVIADKYTELSPYITLTGSPRLPIVVPKSSKI